MTITRFASAGARRTWLRPGPRCRLAVAGAAARQPRLRGALGRAAAWTLRQGYRLLRRPAAEPRPIIRAWAQRLGSLQLRPSGWLTVDRPGPGQLARRRGGPRREHPRHRRHHPLARSSAGLQHGHSRAKPQHHPRRARGHRGNAQPGPGRHRAGRQPDPGRGAALPPRQFLARRTGRMAGTAVATASPRPARHRTAPRPAMQAGRSGGRPAPRHARPGDKPAQRTAREQDTRHDR